MLQLHRPLPKRRTENTIALINIVFLLLIFFLVAGTLAPSADKGIELVETGQSDPADVSTLVSMRADGMLVANGAPVTASQVAQAAFGRDTGTGTVFLAVDRRAPASSLAATVAQLRAGGVDRVIVVTDRSTR